MARPEKTSEPNHRRSKNWLNTTRWQNLRLRILERDEWTCRQTGVLLVGGRDAPNSAVVDHIVPHRGDETLFWNEDNLQSVAKAWHDAEKQRRERNGLA
ncbi:MAG: HNH endonuclease [Pseudomonadota bacterium]